MASTGDILQVKQYFYQSGNEGLLINFYEVFQIGSETLTEAQVAQSLHNLFGTQIVPVFLHSTATYARTVVDNLSGGLSFGDYSDDITGGVGGEPAPSFAAIDIKQSVGNRITRNGRKRLPFIGEVLMNGNNAVIAEPYLSRLETWYSEGFTLENPIDDEPTLILTPVIVGRTETPPDSGIYVLDLDKINLIATADVIGITTQNSRKP